ncbi:MAG: hypothetical protein WC082_13220 [Victivallales bacterium]
MRNDKHQEKFVDHEVFDTIRNAEPVEFYGFTQAVTVTPEMAKIFLKHNTGNRRISDAVNQRYSRIMKAGDWRFNGQTIVFSNMGRLIDGQHRLKAIIRSGLTLPMLVVYGIEDENFKTMDQGCKRTTGQVLNILECKNSNTLAAALRIAYIYFEVDPNLNCSSTAYVYNEALLNFREQHPEMEQSVAIAGAAKGICSTSALAFCHFVFARKCPQFADLFINQLISGEDLHAGHPVLALRNHLIRNKHNKAKLPVRELIVLIFKAWNYCRKMQKIKCLKVNGSDTLPEAI